MQGRHNGYIPHYRQMLVFFCFFFYCVLSHQISTSELSIYQELTSSCGSNAEKNEECPWDGNAQGFHCSTALLDDYTHCKAQLYSKSPVSRHAWNWLLHEYRIEILLVFPQCFSPQPSRGWMSMANGWMAVTLSALRRYTKLITAEGWEWQ